MTKTGPVLLIDEETPKGFLRERIEKMAFDKNLPLYILHFQDVRLDREYCFNALMEKIEEVRPIFVVVDSLIRVHKQKEDESMAMAKVGERSRKIANSGTTLWLIHHHKKGEGPLSQKLRGSSDIPAGVDVEYALLPEDDYLIFSSVKTRTKPLAPIKLKMEIDDQKAEVTYHGIVPGREEEILKEVITILEEKGEAGVKEIHEALKKCDFEFGINRLRKILRKHVSKELIEARGSHGKKVYRLAVSRLHPPIYTGEAVKVEGSECLSSKDNPSIPDGNSEAQTFDSQGVDTSFTASLDSICEAGKAMVKEQQIDLSTDPGLRPSFESSNSGTPSEVRSNQPKYRIGDLFQWVSQGVEQFDRPEKIARIDRDPKSGEWFYFIETATTTTGFPESQVELVEEGT